MWLNVGEVAGGGDWSFVITDVFRTIPRGNSNDIYELLDLPRKSTSIPTLSDDDDDDDAFIHTQTSSHYFGPFKRRRHISQNNSSSYEVLHRIDSFHHDCDRFGIRSSSPFFDW